MADEFADFQDAPAADEFAGFSDAPDTSDADRTPSGLYHFTDAQGNERFSKNAPTAGSKPYVDPTAIDVQPGENFSAGVGKGMVDTGRGVYQLGASMAHAAGMISDDKMAQIQSGIDEAHENDKQLMSTTAGKIGDIAGQAIPMALMPEAGIAGSALEGALTGAIQPVTTGESRTQNMGAGALGGAGGAAAGRVIGGVLGGFGGAKGGQAAADLLKSEGVPTSVAQVTKSKLAQSIERASAMTSDDADEFAQTQRQAFNQAVLRRVGVNDPEVTAATPKVLSDAHDAITGVMNSVSARTHPTLDNALLSDMSNIEQSASRQLPASDIAPITQNLNDILENAAQNGGSLDGTFVKKLNSNLGALSRNPSTAPIAGDLQEAVHNAVVRYAKPDDAAAMAQAQRQFRALKQIEGATDPTTGDISSNALLTRMNTKAYGGRNQVLYARGDQSLVNLARAAKRIIPDKLGNSGTAERALPALTALEIAASGEPIKAGVKAAAGVAGLNSAGRAMRSQGVVGSYLKNGVPLFKGAAPLATSAGAPLGYGAVETQPRDQNQDNDQTITRASGGKVDHEALTARLFNRWKQAQKEADRTTEPLLKFPDETIARALKIAGAHPTP